MPAVVLLLAVLAALFVRHTIAEPFSIPSASMSPALRVGDIVLVDRRQAGRMPARGAVIVFQTADGTAYVKRVIGLPGDDVRLISGFAVLNDHSPLVADAGTCETDRGETTLSRVTETLPGTPPHDLCMEDKPGPWDNTAAVAVPPDALFVLGDNRRNSWDSRTGLGMVPVEKVLGPVTVVLYSWSPTGLRPERILSAVH